MKPPAKVRLTPSSFPSTKYKPAAGIVLLPYYLLTTTMTTLLAAAH